VPARQTARHCFGSVCSALPSPAPGSTGKWNMTLAPCGWLIYGAAIWAIH
jgi:hypothetical protein